jgi:hypothetical protein
MMFSRKLCQGNGRLQVTLKKEAEIHEKVFENGGNENHQAEF